MSRSSSLHPQTRAFFSLACSNDTEAAVTWAPATMVSRAPEERAECEMRGLVLAARRPWGFCAF